MFPGAYRLLDVRESWIRATHQFYDDRHLWIIKDSGRVTVNYLGVYRDIPYFVWITHQPTD
jgi:hypothetical protein